MNIDSKIDCKACGDSFTMREVVELSTDYSSSLDVVVSKVPCCEKEETIRVLDGLVSRGYIYGAGTAHFCGMEEYEAPDLSVLEASDFLSIELNGSRMKIGNETKDIQSR